MRTKSPIASSSKHNELANSPHEKKKKKKEVFQYQKGSIVRHASMASQHVRSRQDMGSEIESISISFFSRAPPCADALSLPRLANFPHPFCSSQSPSKSLESAACVADAY